MRPGSAGAWSPASIFAAGAYGAWYDASDLSTLFSNAAGTTPATVNGIVRHRRDKSGNGFHQTAPSDAASPILRTSGGLYWLEFDGVDDQMYSAANYALSFPHYIGFAASRATAVTNATIFGANVSSVRYHRLLSGSLRINGSARGPSATIATNTNSGSFPAIEIFTVSSQIASNRLDIQKNNVAMAASVDATLVMADTGSARLETCGLATIYQSSPLSSYAELYIRADVSSYRTQLATYLASKCGVTL